MIFRRMVLAFLSLSFASGACFAQVKQDIRGFSPGMSIEQFDRQIDRILDDKFREGQGVSGQLRWWLRAISRIRPEDCSPDLSALNSLNPARCSIGPETIKAVFTYYSKPVTLKTVTLSFYSDTKPPELIDQISQQYHAVPEEKSGENEVYAFSWIGIKTALTSWILSDDLVLTLKGYQSYELVLSSKKTELSEDAAYKEQANKRNMKPKF